MITKGNELTVVQYLQYDLYAAVAAAKRGIHCVLDYNDKGTIIATSYANNPAQ